MSRTDPQFKLRMPAALRAQVEQSAKATRRSVNAEIVIRLESSLAQVAPSTNEEELCLLVQTRNGKIRSLTIHTMRPMPPRVRAADSHAANGLRR